MVSLLPPQSDSTLPGPARLEGEPQGDLMQAPGLPGSPASQNVSTQRLGPNTAQQQLDQSPPTPGDLLGSALSLPAVSKLPSDSKIQRVRIPTSAYPFRLGLSQGRAVHLSDLGHLSSRSRVPSSD